LEDLQRFSAVWTVTFWAVPGPPLFEESGRLLNSKGLSDRKVLCEF